MEDRRRLTIFRLNFFIFSKPGITERRPQRFSPVFSFAALQQKVPSYKIWTVYSLYEPCPPRPRASPPGKPHGSAVKLISTRSQANKPRKEKT
jgi:hypothetical protein